MLKIDLKHAFFLHILNFWIPNFQFLGRLYQEGDTNVIVADQEAQELDANLEQEGKPQSMT